MLILHKEKLDNKKYKFCNHHHELTKDYEIVDFGDGEFVANKEATAITIFKRVRMAYEQLPNYIKPGVKDYGKTGMTLGNDSSIIVSTTTATSIRGTSLSMLAIDETAFIEPHILSEFWSSVIPTISSGKKSKILLVSMYINIC